MSLPYWFLIESSQCQSWKAEFFSVLSGNDLEASELKTDALAIHYASQAQRQWYIKTYNQGRYIRRTDFS